MIYRSDATSIKFTLNLNSENLDTEEIDQQVSRFINQARDLDSVEKIERVISLNAPQNSKSVGGFLAGVITAKVNTKNISSFFSFISDRFGKQPIEMELETPDGRKLKLKASSREEFAFAMDKAQKFIESQRQG